MRFRINKVDLNLIKGRSFFILTLSVMLTYLLIMLLLPNLRLITSIVSQSESLITKVQFLFSLTLGSLLSYTPFEQSIFLFTGLLVGMNASLYFLKRKKYALESNSALIGGQSLAGILSSGCSSCGTSVLSAISATLGIGLSPLHLLLLQLATIMFLLFTFCYTLLKNSACAIPSRS